MAERSKWRRLLTSPVLWAGLAILPLAVLGLHWLDSVGGPAAVRERYGLMAAFVLVPLQAAVAVTPFPSEVVALGTSAIYGFWLGAILIWIAWMIMCLVQYGLARHAAIHLDLRGTQEHLPRWLRRFPVEHPFFLIVGRWVPWGPHFVNCAAGALGVPLWRHLWCAGVANVPTSLIIAGVGTELVRW